ncbi:hypothetical protein B0I37DRAFT_380310 [Chaetomium sp. MPI-CAGE-AT-0009]|nr:hypothetical protein B0I37DRAFT_380310 [Chaetomium sp. MPI-CAGE-AT-0009]
MFWVGCLFGFFGMDAIFRGGVCIDHGYLTYLVAHGLGRSRVCLVGKTGLAGHGVACLSGHIAFVWYGGGPFVKERIWRRRGTVHGRYDTPWEWGMAREGQNTMGWVCRLLVFSIDRASRFKHCISIIPLFNCSLSIARLLRAGG